MIKLCKCGCGKEKKYKPFHKYRNIEYIFGHHRIGLKHSKETKDKISKKLIGRSPNEGSFKKGEHPSPKTEFKKGMEGLKREKSPNWRGGVSFELYGIEFEEKLKEQIRKRDNYTCQECDYTEEQLNYKLSIHHIDYDKKNNEEDNLISLCKSCHSKTNFSREDWTNYFSDGGCFK